LHKKINISNSSPFNFKKGWGCLMARIQISNDPSGRIIVSFLYDPLLVEKVKTIEGRRWHPAEKYWSFPKSNDMLEKILRVLGDNKVQIDTSFKRAVADLQAYNHSIPSLEKGGEGDLNRDCPRSIISKT
jgi:hypothetical protein